MKKVLRPQGNFWYLWVERPVNDLDLTRGFARKEKYDNIEQALKFNPDAEVSIVRTVGGEIEKILF